MHPSAPKTYRRRPCAAHPATPSLGLFFLFSFSLVLFAAAACAPTPKRVVLLVDGQRRILSTLAVTVQDVLREQGISLGEQDRVDPPVYAPVDRSATITVTRIRTQTEVVQLAIPFERKLVRDETYPDGRIHVLELGSNGTTQITYTLTFENGQETERRETGRQVTVQPKNEVLGIGTQGSLASVPITGTVVFLANRNAWVMRNSTGDRRPLTSTGDLDGRVFSLSSDGRSLLYSRAGEQGSGILNSLWLVDTALLEAPRPLPLRDVLYAQLSGDAKTVLYSTGEKTLGAPGWKAHNDLWIASLTLGDKGAAPDLLDRKRLWAPSQPGPYSWWGANFAWAPDGRAVAYAFANEIGFLEIGQAVAAANPEPVARQLLRAFAPFRTRADWVWVPPVVWSPDSRFVMTVVHAPLDAANVANDNPSFEMWVLARDGTVRAPLGKQTGMWAGPVWSTADARSESKIAYGVALSPSDSERSRYALYVMDRDGSNKTQVWPPSGQEGLEVVQVAWSPLVNQLIAVRDGDLWLYDLPTARWSQLTANGASALPRWTR